MAVLVTGGAGYIGSHMVWRLVDAGESVVVIDRLSTGHAWAVAPGARLVVGDIADTMMVRRILREEKVDAILHFAGSVVVPDSVADPLGYYDNNTCATRGLLEAAIDAGVGKLVFSSTAAVYAQGDGTPLAEDAPLEPASPYGRSKLMSEMMLRDTAAAHDLRYAALRYFNVSGADPAGRTGQSTPGATHLLKVACETAVGKRAFMSIYGTDYPTRDGTCIRDFIHVADLVEAHWLALAHLRAGGENLVANLGYGDGFTVSEVIECVQRVSGREFDLRREARRPGDLHAVIANAARARSVLGWRPRHASLEEIVTSALAWEERLRHRRMVAAGPAIESPEPADWPMPVEPEVAGR